MGGRGGRQGAYLGLLNGSLLDDLLDDFLLVTGAKLGIEDLVGCTIEGALLSVPVRDPISVLFGNKLGNVRETE